MGWEQYISAKDLYEQSIDELQKAHDKLQALLTEKQLFFIQYKNWLLDEFAGVLVWYKQHYYSEIDHEELISAFKNQVAETESLNEVIDSIQNLIQNYSNISDIITVLENKYAILCLDGYLPRSFPIHVLPKILLYARSSYLSFLDKGNSVFLTVNESQTQLFEYMIEALAVAQAEDEVQAIFAETIAKARNLIGKRKRHALWFLDDTWNALLNGLISLQESTNTTILAVKPLFPTDEERLSLETAIHNINLQIKLKTQAQEAQALRVRTYPEERAKIVALFDKHIAAVYRGSFYQKGEKRTQQLLALRQKIMESTESLQAAKAINSTIQLIETSHEATSISFNLVLLRKKSRSALALKELLAVCEQQGLLPAIPKCLPSPIEIRFAQAINHYFATDRCFSSRSRRQLAQKLLTEIQNIHAKIDSKEILMIEGKQKIAALVETTIAEAEKLHQRGSGFTRVLRFMGYKGKSRLVHALKSATRDLVQNKHMEYSYQHVTWPVVAAHLNQVKEDYLRNKTTLTTTDIEALRHLETLIDNVHKVINAEEACYLLNASINSFQEAYPEMAGKLASAYQALRDSSILPAIPHKTDFSKFLKDLRRQTADALELKSRIRNIK